MRHSSEQTGPVIGLRERKKARTKATIQEQAVRLFREQGYANTTVEEVAAAAEVAPSTVFRYFPTKQDLVLSSDAYHLPFVLALREQPAELGPIAAERRAIRDILAAIPEGELSAQRDRWTLMVSVPEIWAATLGSIQRSIGVMAEQVAQRAGREPSDPAVRAYTGAVFGVMFTVALDWAKDPDLDFAKTLDEALASLEGGVTL
jgi:AcrR family transcriptional regulator